MLQASSFMFVILYERDENEDSSSSTKRRAAVARRRSTLLTRCPDWKAVENKEMAFDMLQAHSLLIDLVLMRDMLKVLHRGLGGDSFHEFLCVFA